MTKELDSVHCQYEQLDKKGGKNVKMIQRNFPKMTLREAKQTLWIQPEITYFEEK